MSTAYDYVTVSPRDRKARRTVHVPEPVEAPAPKPRRTMRRWGSIVLLVVGTSLVIAYISNAIAVNRLTSDINTLDRSRDSIRTVNEHLRADLLRLMAPERITSIATEKLGMYLPSSPPTDLIITPDNP